MVDDAEVAEEECDFEQIPSPSTKTCEETLGLQTVDEDDENDTQVCNIYTLF